MSYLHLHGYTINTRNITWIGQQGNTLLIHFITYAAPLQIPFASADECSRAHRELLARLEKAS